MKAKIFWKGALIGTLALPLAAAAQSTAGSDPQSAPMGSDPSPSKGAQGAGSDLSATKEVTGTISKVSKSQIVLNAEDGTKMTLKVDSDTRAYQPSGSKVKTTALKEGEQVRASYDMKKDQPHALRIDVIQTGSKEKEKEKAPPSNQ